MTGVALLVGSLLGILPAGAPPSSAVWGVVTHVHLAELVLQDACDDGQLTIFRVDGTDVIGPIGPFAVEAEILDSICTYKQYFRAGVIGPDAYPDILTGQRKIHPDLSRPVSTSWQAGATSGQGTSSSGTDAWLAHLWQNAFPPPNQRTSADQGPSAWKAFVVGYLIHAAGDMYGHSYVNYWTGGPFDLASDNAPKHLLIESYIAKRTPRPGSGFLPASLSGIQRRLYDLMTFAEEGRVLDEQLLIREALELSVPRQFSDLHHDVSAYRKKIDDAPLLTWVGLGPTDAYLAAWLKDIEDGLLAWPEVSHEVIKALFFGQEYPRATVGGPFGTYVTDHFLSMMGQPDATGAAIEVIVEAADLLVPDILGEMAKDLAEWTFQEAVGMSVAEYADMVTDPQRYFDPMMSVAPSGHAITVAEFTRDEMGMDSPTDASFDPKEFPPAYNTIVMTQVLLLSQDEVNRLLTDLGARSRLSAANAMLGFVMSLDEDNQWRDGSQMVFAREPSIYRQIFMTQKGEDPVGVSIAGTVIEDTASVPNGPKGSGQPLEQIRVEVYDSIPLAPPIRYVYTANDGTYEIPWLDDRNRFEVRFEDPAGDHMSEWWDDQRDRQTAVALSPLVGSASLTAVDAALRLRPPGSLGAPAPKTPVATAQPLAPPGSLGAPAPKTPVDATLPLTPPGPMRVGPNPPVNAAARRCFWQVTFDGKTIVSKPGDTAGFTDMPSGFTIALGQNEGRTVTLIGSGAESGAVGSNLGASTFEQYTGEFPILFDRKGGGLVAGRASGTVQVLDAMTYSERSAQLSVEFVIIDDGLMLPNPSTYLFCEVR